mmetsp:Transcript_130406/g.254057  ORF Transcript_130406/g.254057 Transcript_130406/m.254057 type:complete len:421 (+) Transcript_130406:69-1331(+)
MSESPTSRSEKLRGTEELESIEAAQLISGVETRLLQEQITAYVHNCIPCIAVYWGLAVQPFIDGLEHLRVATFLFGTLSFSMVVSVKLASWNAHGTCLASSLRLAEGWCLVARLLMHVVCIAYDGDHTHLFLKVISLWFLPLSAAKETTTYGSFKVYLVCHTILVLARFWGNWEVGPPWVFGTVIVARMLLDLVHSKHSGYKSCEELAHAHAKLKQMAEVTTRKIFERFCDATALLNTDLCIAEAAPGLATLLGISAPSIKGRPFASLVDSEDLGTFHEYMELARAQLNGSNEIEPCETSVKVKLLDAYGTPVPVHLIHACFSHLARGPIYVVGLSETWKPPGRKERGSTSKTMLGTAATAAGASLYSLGLPQPLDPSPTATTHGSVHAGRDVMNRQTSPQASAVFQRRSYSPRPGAARS